MQTQSEHADVVDSLDDLVGIGDIVAAMPADRRRRFYEQLAGVPIEATRPVVPSGLTPFMRLPAPEARTLTRARMAQAAANLLAANGSVTRDDLVAAGFDDAEIRDHFRAAARIAGLARMAV